MIPHDFGSIALDANVIIYAFDREATAPKRAIAREILRRADVFPLRLPLQAAAEIFSVLTRKKRWTRSDAGVVMNSILSDIPHVVTTAETTRMAMRLCANHDVAFWDALLLTSAAASGCGAVLSEDLQDGRLFDKPDVSRPIIIVNPFAPANLPLLAALGAIGD